MRPVARLVVIAFCILILTHAVSTAYSLSGLSSGLTFADLYDTDLDLDVVHVLMAFADELAFAAANVLFLVWVSRAYGNHKSLGIPDQEYSPGWSVGWFFIPLANLFMPFLILRETWKGSDPGILDPREWRKSGVSLVVPVWWFFVLSRQVYWFVLMVFIDTHGNDVHTAVLALLSILAMVFFILVVRGVTSRQEEKNSNLIKASSPASLDGA